jgi:hypothetical protein
MKKDIGLLYEAPQAEPVMLETGSRVLISSPMKTILLTDDPLNPWAAPSFSLGSGAIGEENL